jgi:PAS domain S-box-containing protein
MRTVNWARALFDDTSASRRRLSFVLYAIAAPALALVTFVLAPTARGGLWAMAAILGLSLVAVTWLFIRKRPTPADFVFPMGIVPIACFAIAQVASGYTAVGPMVVVGSTVAIAAALYELPTVLASMATAVVFSFVASLRQHDLVVACGDAAMVMLFQSLAAWVGQGKGTYLRRLQGEGAATLGRLKVSEENFRTFFETIDDMVMVCALDGRITYVNPLLTRKLGYDPGELGGKHAWDLRPAELLAESEQHFELTLQGKSHQCHLPYESKSGVRIPTENRSWLGKWDGEDCVFYTSKDMTAEREAQQRFETMFRKNPAIMAITSVTTERLADVNQTMLDRLGYRKDELIGRTSAEIGLFPHPDLVVELTKRFKSERRLEVPDAPIRCKDGRLLSCSYSGEIITSEGQEYFLSVMVDTTAHKQAEAALQSLNEELKLATERANAMASQAAAASLAKSDFLANMSHEIRTPMNGVIGMTELLLQSGLSEEQRRYAQAISASADRLLALVNDILDLSKVEAGKLVLDVRDFDLYQLLDDLAESMGFRAAEKHLELVQDVANKVPARVRGDAGRLRQILVNLVGNAIKFTEKGEVVLRVHRLPDAGSDVVLRFEVKDTGIGIPDGAIETLFQKFTQVDSSRARKFGGTGLGLAISRQLTELMGGQIGASSQLGVGSTFWFTVKLQPQPEEDAAPSRNMPLAGMRVLVIDDNAATRTALSSRLASWGALAQSVASVDSANTLLKGAQPSRVDVILVDNLPDDGYESFARDLARDLSTSVPQLILMPTTGQRPNDARLRSLGYCCSLYKPIRYAELLDALRSLREGSKASARRRTSTTLRAIEPLSAGESRVLLAEDNLINRQVALGILARLGVPTVAVGDGKEAVRALTRQHFDLVLMDVQMPEMDGIEATRIIRRLQPGDLNEGIPIVALTAHALEADREMCLQAGMNDYLAKPISGSALATTLKKWLDWRDEAGEAVAQDAEPSSSAVATAKHAEGVIDPDVLDVHALLSALNGDRAIARSLADAFPGNAEALLAALAERLHSGDAAGAAQQCHTVKGAAGSMRGVALSAEAARCERLCKDGKLPEARASLGRMRHELDRLKDALEVFRTL